MKKLKFVCLLLTASMLGTGLMACTKEGEGEETSATTIPSSIETVATDPAEEENLDYEYGEHFHSDTPVTYSMFFSDASWYAMQDSWLTDGLFKDIEDITNVHLDIKSYDSSDYMNNITLDINAGESAYIIPKIYDDSAFVDGGAIVPISQYVQYMPNYVDFYNTYGMQEDLLTITRSDGNYYKLPGMYDATMPDYSLLVRKDLFAAAGVDIEAIEKDYTWEDLCDALVKVKAYMVKEGMCSESDYIWSDLWCGNESGQGNGGNLLKLIGNSYDVNAGWAIGDGMRYDQAADKFYFSPVTEKYKSFLKVAHKFVEAGILDPETFTQDDATATNKFFNGQTAIISVNKSQYANFVSNLDANLGAGNYEVYYAVAPQGATNYSPAGAGRLECGVMISQKALDELGEEGFIKMLRFVDWLFYSKEAYTLVKWGVEGKTYQVNADGTKSLLPGMCCSGLGYANDEEGSMTDIRLEWGYAGGNFWYGHTMEEASDHFIPPVAAFVAHVSEYRDAVPLSPGLAPTEDQTEEMNLIATPLTDNVNTWTLSFVTGKEDIDAKWDEYVASCEGLNYTGLEELYAEVYGK
ncbi:MAG: extracellular solute-binding protein [Clostridiales bacterium]|nr:extracellular solute-binding protein [Clostridiales bacterium]